jgi:hypothetical protein
VIRLPEKFGSEAIGWHTIFGVDGEHTTPYMTRIFCGRLRLHIFYRGDADPDPHDHPWDFWTFPLTSYVEEVTREADGRYACEPSVVPAFRWSYRPATYTHRVLGRAVFKFFDGFDDAFAAGMQTGEYGVGPGKIITLVWVGRVWRKWGFLKNRAGQWCWVAWRDYVFGGGKHAPCEPTSELDR